ncbi:hypothetical protein DENSPDRAFT_838113 [Dentipellis sp. KUC8613]|nr:hypothetical protein DENSPDRAFT_838113 [Dentipellis sp. KUC8613]
MSAHQGSLSPGIYPGSPTTIERSLADDGSTTAGAPADNYDDVGSPPPSMYDSFASFPSTPNSTAYYGAPSPSVHATPPPDAYDARTPSARGTPGPVTHEADGPSGDTTPEFPGLFSPLDSEDGTPTSSIRGTPSRSVHEGRTTGSRDSRTPSDPGTPRPGHNHPSLYFEQGDVMISCFDTIFRVHRDVLEQHSDILRERLDSRLNPESAFSTFYDCVYLVIDDVKVEDLEAFLGVVYRGLESEVNRATFPVLAGALRFSSKYGAFRMRNTIMVILKSYWSSDKDVYLKRYHDGVFNAQDQVHPAQALALLRQVNCEDKDLVSVLFYHVSCRASSLGTSVKGFGQDLSEMSSADIQRLARGISELLRLQMLWTDLDEKLFLGLHRPNPCRASYECLPKLRKFWQEIAMPIIASSDGMSHPFESWDCLLSKSREYLVGKVCSACRTRCLDRISRARQAFWDDLPQIFHVS